MSPIFQRLMQRATQLTRSGDLHAATAAIQAALHQSMHAPAATGQARPAGQAQSQSRSQSQSPSERQPQSQARSPAHAIEQDVEVIDVDAREVTEPAVPDIADAPDANAAASHPTAGRFIAGTHAHAAQERAFKLYVPPQAGEAALPLVVMLHGCTQDAADFAAGTAMNELARQQGFFVLYPEQSSQANPQRCWNWFKHSHQARGRGEPALLAGMVRHVMAEHGIDPARVYVAGLSAGGAMAAILGDTYPDLFAAVGVHSGLAAGAAKDLPSAFGAMRSGPQGVSSRKASGVPTIVFHGDADTTVHPGNAEHVIAASVAEDSAVDIEQGRSPGGRTFTRSVHRAPDTGKAVAEHWVVHGAPHAWSGGSADGSYTDPDGPDAALAMVRFFMEHRRA